MTATVKELNGAHYAVEVSMPDKRVITFSYMVESDDLLAVGTYDGYSGNEFKQAKEAALKALELHREGQHDASTTA